MEIPGSGMKADGGFAGNEERTKHAALKPKPSIVSRRQGAAILIIIVTIGLGAAVLAPSDSTTASPDRERACDCHNTGSEDLLIVTGLPTQYIPTATYTITIQLADPNPSDGENGFYLTIDGGTLSNAGSNAEVNSATQSASTVDSRPRLESSWTVDWTAPASGVVSIHVWGVSATDSLTGQNSPYDDDVITLTTGEPIPEFNLLIVPIISMVCAVIIAARISRQAKR